MAADVLTILAAVFSLCLLVYMFMPSSYELRDTHEDDGKGEGK